MDGADTRVGGDGDDSSEGGIGNDRLDGENARDLLLGGEGDDFLYGDGLKIAFAPETAFQVYRLYLATLMREPDQSGHLHWTQAIVEGELAPAQVAAGFVGSQEFRNIYGPLDDAAFVELLYENVLGRASDAAGSQGWRDMLANGASRAEVVLGFSDSPEFGNATRVDSAAWVNGHTDSIWSDDVYRLYRATLDREPDLAGFLDWVEQLGSGRPYLEVVEGFTGAREFQNTYGTLDDPAFVELLYQNVLNRTADAQGLADWVGRLESGWTRAQVVEGFAQSREFVNAVAAPLEVWVRSQGTDDTLDGGSGVNMLTGGRLSDTFVFNEADDATVAVVDLEAWDSLDFRGFGYATSAEALAAMSQSGSDVVFADQGVTITFLNTDLALIDDGMIL